MKIQFVFLTKNVKQQYIKYKQISETLKKKII